MTGPATSLLDANTDTGNVPLWAMKVTRDVPLRSKRLGQAFVEARR